MRNAPTARLPASGFFPDGILAFLPLDGAQGNSVAVVWSVIKERVPELLALEPQEFAQRLQDASHGALGALQLSGERAAWPLQQARANRWCGALPMQGGQARSWVLAGDAAHNVHPLARTRAEHGAGRCAGPGRGAARDATTGAAWRICACWRGYERERKADMLPMGLATDSLQQLFARTEGPWQRLRNWGMKGFERSGPLKEWMARQAMGTH